MSSSLITCPFTHERQAGPFADDDNRYPESLVRHFLDAFTKKDDKVFDPFMGLGTTAFVCEEMGRVPYGIEHNQDRFEWSAGQLEHWNHIVWDDAANMKQHDFPKMDFAITSPPYMPKHHKWNPLYGGDPAKAGYDKYLKRMGFIFKQMTDIIKRNALVVVQLDNLRGKVFTPLVWDVGQEIGKYMRLDDEIIVKWAPAAADYPHTHCLIFKNTRQ